MGIFKRNKNCSLQIDEEYVQKSHREVDMMMERHRKALETLEIELETNMRELVTLQVCACRPSKKNLGQEGKILVAIILDTNKTETKTPM